MLVEDCKTSTSNALSVGYQSYPSLIECSNQSITIVISESTFILIENLIIENLKTLRSQEPASQFDLLLEVTVSYFRGLLHD